MKKSSISRLTLIGAVLTTSSSLIVLQMLHIQNSSKHQELSQWADEEYSYAIENYTPERGNIYDRWGRLLAGNEDVYEAGVMLEYVTNPSTIAQTMEGVNNLTYDQVYDVVSQPYNEENSIYAVITDFLPSGVIDVLSNIKQTYETENPYGKDPQLPSLRGLIWSSHLKRSYPENSCGSVR